MPIRIGSTILQISRKKKECTKCHELILPGEIYNTKLGLKIYKQADGSPDKAAKFSYSYHDRCWEKEYFEKKEELLEIHRKIEAHEPGIRKSKLRKLTPEQRKRRKTLQMYLTERDIPALVNAYERHSTERVIRVMELIAERWEELQEMGVPFRASLTSDRNNDNDEKLRTYLLKYDQQWMMWKWENAATVEDMLQALHRDPEDRPPDWSK